MRDALAAPRSEYGRGVGPATPDTADAPRHTDALYWSRRGEVACVMHAPERDSSRWPEEQWAPMPATAMRRHGIGYQCQHCSASGRPIAHRRIDRRRDVAAVQPTEVLNDMPNTLWRLRGSTDKVIECCVDRTDSTLHSITILLNHETLLNECYPDDTSARTRALQVRDGLLKSGGWTLVHPTAAGLSPR